VFYYSISLIEDAKVRKKTMLKIEKCTGDVKFTISGEIEFLFDKAHMFIK